MSLLSCNCILSITSVEGPNKDSIFVYLASIYHSINCINCVFSILDAMTFAAWMTRWGETPPPRARQFLETAKGSPAAAFHMQTKKPRAHTPNYLFKVSHTKPIFPLP